jgi:hypothetical protein
MASTINTWTDITCQDCDTDLDLGAIDADQNCNELPQESQISDLYIAATGATKPFDWSTITAPSAVSGAIDNTVTDSSKTKWIVGKGGIPEAEEVPYNAPKGRVVIAKRKYTLTFEVIVTDVAMYNLIRQLQCGWTDFTFNYGDKSGQLYGNDIVPTSVNGQLPKDPADDGLDIGRIIITFETDNGDPVRAANPLA